MPQATNPQGTLTLYTPQPGDPHSVAHPYVVFDASLQEGFTLIAGADGAYALNFRNGMATTDPGGNANGMVYVSFFADSVLNPIRVYTSTLIPDTEHSRSGAGFGFNPGEITGATDVWVGSWWDDGSYPSTRDGVIAYFRDHPEGGSHHTVPIRIG